MHIEPDVTLPPVRLAHIRPYVSLLVLQIEDRGVAGSVFDTMVGRVRSWRRVAPMALTLDWLE
jgi:hypothetical protein